MQNTTGTGIAGFRTIGKFDRQQVEGVVKKVCQLIGKPWDSLNEREKNVYLTIGANALSNRPTILAQTDDLPDLEGANTIQFHRLFLAEMRNLPNWNFEEWLHGYPVDGVTGYGESRTGASTNQQESRR